MKLTHTPRWIAATAISSVLAFTALNTAAQPMPPTDMMHHHMDGKWHEQMLAHWEKHMQSLKTKLHLSSAQDGAWQNFTAAVKPPAKPEFQTLKREDLEKLTTPERIEKLTAMHEARHQAMQAHMKQMSDATLAFYKQLTTEQQKTFDAESLPRAPHHRGDEAKAH